jgi:hypothetical protein
VASAPVPEWRQSAQPWRSISPSPHLTSHQPSPDQTRPDIVWMSLSIILSFHSLVSHSLPLIRTSPFPYSQAIRRQDVSVARGDPWGGTAKRDQPLTLRSACPSVTYMYIPLYNRNSNVPYQSIHDDALPGHSWISAAIQPSMFAGYVMGHGRLWTRLENQEGSRASKYDHVRWEGTHQMDHLPWLVGNPAIVEALCSLA